MTESINLADIRLGYSLYWQNCLCVKFGVYGVFLLGGVQKYLDKV